MANATPTTTEPVARYDAVTGLPLDNTVTADNTVPADTAQANASGFPGDAATDTTIYVVSVAPTGVVPSLAMCSRDQAEAMRAAYIDPLAGYGYTSDDIKVYALGTTVLDFTA